MITVQIGNTDDKLNQWQWSKYARNVDNLIQALTQNVYFSGYSLPDAPWQNAAWCFDCDDEDRLSLRKDLVRIAKEFRQDSIAWTEGVTEMVETKGSS